MSRFTQVTDAMNPAPDSTPSAEPTAGPTADRALRLAARLKGRCLRSGGTGPALHETSVLDSGSLAALPRLSADLLHLQEHSVLPADPLRQLLDPQAGRTAGGRWIWTLGRRKPAQARVPVLSGAQWQSWQTEVTQTSERLAQQWGQLSTLQARQELLSEDLQTDALILTRAAETLLADPELPGLWRDELAQALRERALEIRTALEVAGQLGGALRLMQGNHALLQERLLAASRLLLYAAQTGLSLQQALEAQVSLGALPDFPATRPSREDQPFQNDQE